MEKYGERTVIVYEKETGKTLEHTDINLPAMRSITGFSKGEWNLDAYADSFGGANRLGDIDASIEIDGHHLVIEFKEHKNSMNAGQLVKAIRLAKYANTTTVFVFGKTNASKEKIMIRPSNVKGWVSPTNEEDLKILFRKWYSYAKLNPMNNRAGLYEDWTVANKLLEKVSRNKVKK
ncbi:hypothetical protein [Shouchella miscanthi]|uniref:Restriction endonuclease type IV Mrr domain-containing protein n=1 Tax=Shouchella miscanthi TaxID=2598861 RepID=A0ABU6NKJ8_9BACI|nr:hypothetical protein [Shouchella miscanthi]